MAKSIDLVFHTPVSPARLLGDGSGQFPTMDFSNHQRRLGTASSGHGRQYLVSDFIKRANDPHYTESFKQKLQTPKAFNVKKTEFTTLIESMGHTSRITRPSVHTQRAMQENFKRLM